MSEQNELRRLAEAANSPNWQRGTAGGANVVSYNGEDIVGVCRASSELKADFIAAANPAVILKLLDRIEALERTDEQIRDAALEEVANSIKGSKLDQWAMFYHLVNSLKSGKSDAQDGATPVLEKCAAICDKQAAEWDSDAVVTEKNYAAHCGGLIRALMGKEPT